MSTDEISLSELNRRKALIPEVSGDQEFRCVRCHARCTRGLEGEEYGHYDNCPNRPEDWPRGGSRTYDPEKDPLATDGEQQQIVTDGGEI